MSNIGTDEAKNGWEPMGAYPTLRGVSIVLIRDIPCITPVSYKNLTYQKIKSHLEKVTQSFKG